MTKMPKRVVTGITATNTLTIGHYLGVIKNLIKLQNQHQMLVFVADLHNLTMPFEPKKLKQNRHAIMALYIACGLDPKKVHLFFQSEIEEHTQMLWLLGTKVTVGELKRMIQFKEKSSKLKLENQTKTIPINLLNYPILMAADILLYNPDIIPVGQDQIQHMELVRNIAKRINKKYGKIFKIPQIYLDKQNSKILSLTNPKMKMSKSDLKIKSYISLLDKPNIASKKIFGAKTDSENKIYLDEQKKPGITNLLNIYAGLTNIDVNIVASKFQNNTYQEFKKALVILVTQFLEKIQKNYLKALTKVPKISQKGKIEAQKIASKVLKNLKTQMGLK